MSLEQEEFKRREKIVIEQFDGIINYCEPFYIYSIHYSADRAIAAFERFLEASSQKTPNAPLVVSSLHEALSHASALSRFFWPVRTNPIHLARAEKLRKAFQLKDSSALRDSALRNALEHFDERLDAFLIENEVGYFRPAPALGSRDEINEVDRIFKLVDLDEKVFVILNETYSFEPIILATSEVMQRAILMAKQDHL